LLGELVVDLLLELHLRLALVVIEFIHVQGPRDSPPALPEEDVARTYILEPIALTPEVALIFEPETTLHN
jgi:hypothetical protein